MLRWNQVAADPSGRVTCAQRVQGMCVLCLASRMWGGTTACLGHIAQRLAIAPDTLCYMPNAKLTDALRAMAMK